MKPGDTHAARLGFYHSVLFIREYKEWVFAVNWCIIQFGDSSSQAWHNSNWFIAADNRFWFKREQDAVLFALRWA